MNGNPSNPLDKRLPDFCLNSVFSGDTAPNYSACQGQNILLSELILKPAMDKEVLIAIIGAISVMGAALFQSGLIPELISNDNPVDELPENASSNQDNPNTQEAGTDIESNATTEKGAEKVIPDFFSEEDPAVAVSSWGPGRLDLFVRGTDDALYHRSMNRSTWSNWKCLGGKLNSAPAAVSRKPGSIDVFAIGNDNALWHICLGGSTWSDWKPLGGNWTSAPAASSWGEDRLDVFVRGRDNALWHRCLNGSTSTWTSSDWESLTGNCTSAPAAISPGEEVIYVLVKDGDDDLKWKAYRWGSWTTSWMQVPIIPGMSGDINFTSAPAVSSASENCLEVFIRGDDNALLHSFWDGKQYRVDPQPTWVILSSGELASAPASVAWNINYIWVFAKGTDNNLIGGYWEPTTETWYGFDSIGKWPPE